MAKITVRRMEVDDARAFLETHRASVRGVASMDYAPQVIEAWSPLVTDERVAAFLENPDKEVRFVAKFPKIVRQTSSRAATSFRRFMCDPTPDTILAADCTARGIFEEARKLESGNGWCWWSLTVPATGQAKPDAFEGNPCASPGKRAATVKPKDL